MKSLAAKTNKSLKIGLIFFVFLAVITFAGGWYYSLKMNEDLSRLATGVKFLNQESAVKTEIVQKYKRVANYEYLVSDTLPKSKEVSSYLADFEELAKKNGISIGQSTIGTTSTKVKQADLDLSQTVVQKDYYELPIKYTVEGSYQSFQQLLIDLSNLRRLNTVSEVNVTKSNEAGDAVQITFVNIVYIKK